GPFDDGRPQGLIGQFLQRSSRPVPVVELDDVPVDADGVELRDLLSDLGGLDATLQRRVQQAGEAALGQQTQIRLERDRPFLGQRHAGCASGQYSGGIGARDAVPQKNDDGHAIKVSPDRLGWAYETSASTYDLRIPQGFVLQGCAAFGQPAGAQRRSGIRQMGARPDSGLRRRCAHGVAAPQDHAAGAEHLTGGHACIRKSPRTRVPNFSAKIGTRSSTPWNIAGKSRSPVSCRGAKPYPVMPISAMDLLSVPPESV